MMRVGHRVNLHLFLTILTMRFRWGNYEFYQNIFDCVEFKLLFTWVLATWRLLSGCVALQHTWNLLTVSCRYIWFFLKTIQSPKYWKIKVIITKCDTDSTLNRIGVASWKSYMLLHIVTYKLCFQDPSKRMFWMKRLFMHEFLRVRFLQIFLSAQNIVVRESRAFEDCDI